MSWRGIHQVARILTAIQLTKVDLFRSQTKKHGLDMQDIALARMLEKMENAVKDDFARIVDKSKDAPK